MSLHILLTEWQNLASELEMLHPSRLAHQELEAILEARKDPQNNSFHRTLPIIVAHFKKASMDEIYSWASRQNHAPFVRSNAEYYAGCSDPYIIELGTKFAVDVAKIHNVLFQNNPRRKIDNFECHIGHFKNQRVPILHRDGTWRMKLQSVYLARVGSLPVEVIPEKRIDDFYNLRKRGADNYDALRQQEILIPIPLGSVMMGATEWISPRKENSERGTLHCSSPVPANGAFSAFFRVFAPMGPR